MNVEERLAALERWRDAMVTADLAEVERMDPARAAAIRAMGLLRADFDRLYLLNVSGLVVCLTCGSAAEATRMAKGPAHLATCPLAPKPERAQGVLSCLRLGHG